jgi:hypothetical protein
MGSDVAVKQTDIVLKSEHSWNLDSTIASVVAQGLQLLIDRGSVVPPDTKRALLVFNRYTKRWDNSDAFEYYEGSDLDADMKWAMKWLSDNFYSLWD